MRIPLLLFTCLLNCSLFGAEVEDDPRPGVSAYFDAIRKGDEKAALDCWLKDVSKDEDKYVQDVVTAYVQAHLAMFAMETVIAAKLPELAKETKSKSPIPTPDAIAAAKFTVYRRLAIVKWGTGEDEGLPMVFDNGDPKKNRWKISMQQWFETNHSSVGDPMLLSGWEQTAMRQTTADVKSGKLKTKDAIEDAFLHYMEVNAKKAEKKEEALDKKAEQIEKKP